MMYDDEFDYREGDDSLIGIIIGFILLTVLLIGASILLIGLPFLAMYCLDDILLGSVIPWYLEILISFTITIYGLTWFTDLPKNPIDWYIIFFRPVMEANDSVDTMEVLAWVEENIPGRWSHFGEKAYQFLRARDAMAFKLRWY